MTAANNHEDSDIMSIKLPDILKNTVTEEGEGVLTSISGYRRRFFGSKAEGDAGERKQNYKNFANVYYDLVTDFFEYGWGQSFHFAPRAPKESFPASLARHEHYMALMLGLRHGMTAVDLGCGVGGPLREIARFSGAKVVGVNNNAYQLERAEKLTEAAGLSHLAQYLKCDFMQIDAPDNSFDAVYAIEATCCAPDKAGIYREAHRLLKPGACFGNYEYCMTDRYDATNPAHQALKTDMEVGGGLQDIARPHEVDDALREAGFELLEARDLAVQPGPGIPWYQPLTGSGWSMAGFRSSDLGRWVTSASLRALETVRIVPRGATQVSDMLNLCAAAIAKSGQLEIFTPMYFTLARKPE